MRYFEVHPHHPFEEMWYLNEPVSSSTNDYQIVSSWAFGEGQGYFGPRDLTILLNKHGSIPGIPVDITFGYGTLIVVNKKTADILAAVAPNDFELIRCRVEMHDNDDDNYYILNVIKAVDCFDVTRTARFKIFDEKDTPLPVRIGDYHSVFGMKIHQRNIRSQKMFRVIRLKTSLIVDEDIKNVLEKAGCTGIQFADVT